MDTEKLGIEKRIVYEDNHIIVINKLTGELSQGDKTDDISLIDDIKSYLKSKYNKPGDVFLGVLHRLDRVSSGLIIYCKTSKSLSKFNELLKDGYIDKTYLCVVKQISKDNQIKDKDTLVHYLLRNSKQNISKAYDKEIKGSKKAILEYERLESINNYHLFQVNLITGRHHQIRAQLKKIGLVIRGDVKYGDDRPLKNKGILLHAYKLSFTHPIKDTKLELIVKPYNYDLWYKFNFLQ